MREKQNLVAVQAARGAAVVLVMLFHASQVSDHYFAYNYLGVSGMGRSGAYTFFFALTGYLMFTLYRHRFGDHSAFGPFLIKRFARIYPLYWLITAAVVPMYFIVPSFGFGYERKPSVIVESLLLWPQQNAPILGVAWSLTYVVWFYLIFSLFFIMKRRAAAALVVSWLTLIVFNALGWIHMKNSVLINFLFNEANLEFFAGVAVAYAVKRWRIGGLWWIAAGALTYPLLWMLRLGQQVPSSDLLYTLGSALLLVGVVTWQAQETRWLKPLVYCGNASYSILLASLPMMSVTFKLARGAHLIKYLGPAATVTLCFLTGLLLCLLVYRFVERPLLTTVMRQVSAAGWISSRKAVTSS
ncbi:acyltransferase [Paenibacillus filicis]|uniref:Acyltransferase n=1 Tax=Paenibacillus gyeongsangnamensis TaxID=3388067 RepID=A0ABT4QH52_9BACL|nr:acyltransferase [Paenibacillus filicis]MCZ8516222.1 acyltransferase [Paenibacillus filicis]